MIALTLLTLILLALTWWWWQLVRADEVPAAQREHALCAAMERAMTDAHECDVCHERATVRELVALYDDAALCCLRCATLIKYRRSA